ncbi:MAG: homoserine O-acetyltransferase [Bacteroidota bacterium]
MSLTPQNCQYPLPIEIDDLNYYHHEQSLPLESGRQLPHFTVAYHTYGQLNTSRDNVIWVFHALTANSEVADWWSGLFGPGRILDPEQYFIVCPNILGSCYGTTGARSINPETGVAYGMDFPLITIRDMAKVHECLRAHLGIEKIHLALGGSCGGHQIQEYTWSFPERVRQMAMLVTSPKETAWAISIHEAGRMSIEADPSHRENTDAAGSKGLQAARAMGLLGYRTIQAYIDTQTDLEEKMDGFKAASYVRYQGLKLDRRFYTHCYWYLLKALDSHDIGRGRGGAAHALSQINVPALVIGIDTDMLIPPMQQKFIVEHLPKAVYREIHSKYGHDGFLIESEQINQIIGDWICAYSEKEDCNFVNG